MLRPSPLPRYHCSKERSTRPQDKPCKWHLVLQRRKPLSPLPLRQLLLKLHLLRQPRRQRKRASPLPLHRCSWPAMRQLHMDKKSLPRGMNALVSDR